MNQMPASTTPAAIHVRKRMGGRGGGTEPLLAGFAGGALDGTGAAGAGWGAGAGLASAAGWTAGWTAGTGIGGGLRGTGGGAAAAVAADNGGGTAAAGTTFSKTTGAATWRVPQNGQCARRSGK
ncbi:hypothetical protein [Janthinobacterium sp. RT4P48]|uniref:hypothetical protein n=1 Tax=Janthinobacterium sp. RT4P48 TaxID=3424188 RepID=UPI003F23ABE7